MPRGEIKSAKIMTYVAQPDFPRIEVFEVQPEIGDRYLLIEQEDDSEQDGFFGLVTNSIALSTEKLHELISALTSLERIYPSARDRATRI